MRMCPRKPIAVSSTTQRQAADSLDRLSLTEGGSFLVSAHREENVDSPARLQMLLECLVTVHAKWGLPVYVSTHPRTRKRLEALPDWTEPEGIVFHEPFGFHDFNRLQLSAACVLSDSGTIAEESTILGFPAITLRDSIERPEALDTGGVIMTGLDARDVVAAVNVAMANKPTRDGVSAITPNDYLINNTSVRAVNYILSTAHRHATWAGIRSKP